ncbi:MAG: FAD-dependent oxidoreductase, partial [Oscillospiraceae bacterium]
MRVLIVGGVAGGASAAARLRRLDEQAEIVLFERGPYVSFANCGLPYYIGGEITERPALTLQTPESFWARFAVEVRVNTEVVSINRAEKTVTALDAKTGARTIERYDRLLLSPGAEPLRPPLPGIGLEGVFTLRNIPDTDRIKAFLEQKKPRRAVVVGGGMIGVEMAENFVRAGLEVTIVERSDHLIASLDFDSACDLHSYLLSKGVGLRLSSAVSAIGPGPEGLSVTLDCGAALDAGLVLLSAGVRPETGLAKDAGLAHNARGCILVDEHLRTSDPDIYAVGDAIECVNWLSGTPDYIPLAGPANRQGRIAADNIAGLDSTYGGTQGSAVLKVFEMTVACTGLTEQAARARGIACDKVYTYSASHATYYPGAQNMAIKLLFELPGGRVLGAQLVGFEGVDKRCDVLATAIRAKLTVYDLTRLELCYAPPFSSAKDPVNMLGFAAENILTGKVKNFHWEQLDSLDPAAVTRLDVRTPEEFSSGSV